VRRANIAIAKLDTDFAREKMGVGTANSILGQAYFLKAAFYYMQARKYGGWIIVDESLDEIGAAAGADENTAQKLKLPRATIKETYDYAIALCEKAAELMNTDAKAGVLSKGAAYALLSEICLHGAAYISFYEGADPKPYYEKTIKAVEDLDALNKYSLVSGDNFGKMFNDYSYAQSCPENIFFIQRNELYARTDGKYIHIHRLLAKCHTSMLNLNNLNISFQPLNKGYQVSDGQAQVLPDPLMAEKAYYVKDSDGKARRFEDSKLFAENIDIVTEEDKIVSGKTYKKRKLKATSTYTSISDLLYSHRDDRFKGTYVYDGSEFLGNTIYFRTGGNLHRMSYLQTNREFGSMTGMLYSKRIPQNKDLTSNGLIDFTNPIFRLGRCYLNVAEAYLSLNNDSKAREYINKTRVTHGGLAALTDESGGELKMIYLDERVAELNLENDRYFTLLRTGLSWGVTDATTGYPTGVKGGIIPELNRGNNPTPKIEIEVPGDYKVETDFMKPNAYFYKDELDQPQSDHDFVFTAEKRYLLPVPESELMQNENLWQNDNWK
jgi:hypothetical protein